MFWDDWLISFLVLTLASIILMWILVILFLVTTAKLSIDNETYCLQRSRIIVGNKWNLMFDPEPSEYGYVPFGGKIALGLREQLKCERERRLF